MHEPRQSRVAGEAYVRPIKGINMNLPKAYLRIGLQYFHLVKNCIDETIKVENNWVIVTDNEHNIDWEQYDIDTKWSDFNIVIPIIFDYYHGIEVVMKGFLLANNPCISNTKHKLSGLLSEFIKLYPNNLLGNIFQRYIEKSKMPELLNDFCSSSQIDIDEYYQALKYPNSTYNRIYDHYSLMYKGKNGKAFFIDLRNDINDIMNQIIILGKNLNL